MPDRPLVSDAAGAPDGTAAAQKRTCQRCGQEKPVEAMARNRWGVTKTCRDCWKAMVADGMRLAHATRPTRLCEVDGCDRKHRALGLCGLHYQRLRYRTRPRKPRPMSAQPRPKKAKRPAKPKPPTPPFEQAVRCIVCGDLTPVSKLARAGGRPLKVCRRCRTVTRQASAVGDISAVSAAALEPHRITVTCTAGCCWTVPAPDTWRPDMWALAEAAVSHLLRAPGCTGRPRGVYDQEVAA